MLRTLKNFGKAILPQGLQTYWRVRRAMRSPSDPEVKLLHFFSQGGLFLDVGANIGTWSGPACQVFQQVHAFEPDTELASALKRAGPANLTVHCCALSDREGRGQFAVPVFQGRAVSTRGSLEAQANEGLESVVREIVLTRLDTLGLRSIDVIKIDVEGHEATMLRGAVETIARERPVLIVEIEDRHHEGRSEAIIASLMSRDYDCHFLRDGRLEDFQPGSMPALQPVEHRPVPGRASVAHAYINNFIFVPHEKRAQAEAARRFCAEQLTAESAVS